MTSAVLKSAGDDIRGGVRVHGVNTQRGINEDVAGVFDVCLVVDSHVEIRASTFSSRVDDDWVRQHLRVGDDEL
jgi:hypothetical protein